MSLGCATYDEKWRNKGSECESRINTEYCFVIAALRHSYKVVVSLLLRRRFSPRISALHASFRLPAVKVLRGIDVLPRDTKDQGDVSPYEASVDSVHEGQDARFIKTYVPRRRISNNTAPCEVHKVDERKQHIQEDEEDLEIWINEV